MFNKHQGLTAREWNRAYQNAAKGRERSDSNLIAAKETIEILSAKLTLEENRLASSKQYNRHIQKRADAHLTHFQEQADCKLCAVKEAAMFTQEQILTSKSGTYYGLSIGGWYNEYQKLDKEYLERKKQLDAATNEIKRLDAVVKSRNEQIDVLTGKHFLKNSVPIPSLVRIRDERDIAESRLADCEEKLGETEAVLQLEKMKNGARGLSLIECKYLINGLREELRVLQSNNMKRKQNATSWKKECGILVKQIEQLKAAHLLLDKTPLILYNPRMRLWSNGKMCGFQP